MTDTTTTALPVAGRTTEDVLRALATVMSPTDTSCVAETVRALVARFDRKAERRAAKAAA